MSDGKPVKTKDGEHQPEGSLADAHNFMMHDPADGDVRKDPAWRKLVGLPAEK